MLPRPQHNNEIVLTARHTLELRLFLLPEKELRELAGYCLGLALAQTSVELITACVLPDRVLLVLLDPACERSDFQCLFISLFARALNRKMGRSGAPIFGPPDTDGPTPILDPDALLEAMAEVLAAPADLDLVASHKSWPGLVLGPQSWGKTMSFERPEGFFRDSMPEQVDFVVSAPPGFEALGEQGLREQVRQRVNARELAAAMERKARGAQVVGLKALRKMARGATVKTPPERHERKDFRTRSKALAEAAVKRGRIFVALHAEARRRMLDDDDLPFRFPEGTYWWRRWANANCVHPREREPFDPIFDPM